jgi:hypothetical protein
MPAYFVSDYSNRAANSRTELGAHVVNRLDVVLPVFAEEVLVKVMRERVNTTFVTPDVVAAFRSLISLL